MSGFNIQRGSFDFGATEDTDTVTLGTAVASLNVAFARITGIRFASGGPAAGTTGDRYNDDLGVTCLLTATNTITFVRESGGTNEDVRVYWEVIEGPSSGPFSIAVRYHNNISVSGGTTQQDQAVSGITTLADCVPFICGTRNDDTLDRWDKVSFTAKMVDVSGNKVRLDRVDSGTGTSTVVSVAVVEFTGSFWTVQNNIEHNYTAAGTNETETITDVSDTSHAFVICGHRCDGSFGDELGYNCWFKDSNELYFRIESSASTPGSDYTVAHVVRNDNMTVQHLDSITGSGTDHPFAVQSITTSVTAVTDTAESSVFATADDDGTSYTYPRPFWQYRLTDTDEVTWWRGRHGSLAEWTLQVVQWPTEYIKGSSAGTATATGTLSSGVFRIQRGSFDFGATEDTDTVTLSTTVTSLNQAFARITGVRFASGGPAAGTTADRNCDDLGVTCLLTAVDTITFTRESTGTDEDVRVYWEVVELPGNGSNAAVVRYYGNIDVSATTSQVDTAVSGVSTLGDCVPFICGVKSARPTQWWGDASFTAKMVTSGGDKVRLDRVYTANDATVSVVVVEFTGSSWTVQNNIEHNYTAAGTNETETITSVVDTTHAFVVVGHRCAGEWNDDLGYNCWFKDADELYFRIDDNASTPSSDYTVAHVVRNDSVVTQHLDSITGSGTDHPAGSSSPQSVTTTVTTVGDLGLTSVFASADDSGAAANYPQPFWLYRLTSTSQVTWWRGRYNSTGEWALQVVQWPTNFMSGSSAGTSTATGALSFISYNFKVQRGSFDFGASEDTDTVTLSSSVPSLDVAFARITCTKFASGGPAAGTTTDRNADDLGVTCLLTATDTVTFTRESSGDNEDVRVYWEVIEFPSSGPNAAVVRYHDTISMVSTGQVDTAVSGVSTLGDCVPFICGIRTTQTNPYWDDGSVTAKMVDVSGDKVRLDRASTGGTTNVSVAVVEFTGSNWIVQNNIEHNYTAAGTNETESITSVADISHAFVVCAHRCVDSSNDELGYNCWFKDVDELYFRIYTSAGSPSSDYTVAHVVRNDGMIVQHLDSITGSGTDHPSGSSSPQSLTTSVTTVNDTGSVSVFASADDSNTANDYPQPFWLYRLTDTDEVTWWRGRYGSTAEWALQVVQWPTDVLKGTASGQATATGAIAGEGELAGTSAGQATETATLQGDGELAGTSAGTSTGTGVLQGIDNISGTSAGTSTASGTLEGKNLMDGVSAGTSTATGTIAGEGELAGTSAGQATETATLQGDGELAGTSAGTSTGTGVLQGIDNISGTSAGTSTASGTLEGKSLMTGTSAGQATVAGDLNGDGALAGTSVGASTASGTAGAVGYVVGASAGAGAATGSLSALANIVGASAGSSTAAGTLVGVSLIEGVASGTSSSIAFLKGRSLLTSTPESRQHMANIERRRREAIERARFQNNNRQYGTTPEGKFTFYPSRILPHRHTTRQPEHLLDGASEGFRDPTIP